MAEDRPFSFVLRRSQLAGRRPTAIDLAPDAAGRARIAGELGLLDLPQVRLRGRLAPAGRADFTLDALLEANVVQPCVVTTAPVTTEIREPVVRRYLADWQEPDGEEVEIPEDDTIEPLGSEIDVGAVLVEALALALPLYPRAAEGAQEDAGAASADPEEPPVGRTRPFAGLADLLGGGKTGDKG